jgi:hypothetical protein
MLRVCEVTSRAVRREAGKLLRYDILSHVGVPVRVTQYILNVSTSNWNVRFPWHRVVIAGNTVMGVILCEPDDSTRSLEVRFISGNDGVVKALLDAAKAFCASQGYTCMWLWCAECFPDCRRQFEEYGFVFERRQENWETSDHYSSLYKIFIPNP